MWGWLDKLIGLHLSTNQFLISKISRHVHVYWACCVILFYMELVWINLSLKYEFEWEDKNDPINSYEKKWINYESPPVCRYLDSPRGPAPRRPVSYSAWISGREKCHPTLHLIPSRWRMYSLLNENQNYLNHYRFCAPLRFKRGFIARHIHT